MNVIRGDLPADWELMPRNFPERTPGSVFVVRVLEKGQLPIPARACRRHSEFVVTGTAWAAVEYWCSEADSVCEGPGRYRLSTGTRLWRRHTRNRPRKLP